jgi:hypothetical protein
MAQASSKKGKKKIRKTKKAFQKIIDLLDGKSPTLSKKVIPFMDIYWAEDSEVNTETPPKRTGS